MPESADVNRQFNGTGFSRGETLSQEMRCGICHWPTYVGREQMPRLAGQLIGQFEKTSPVFNRQ